MFLQENKYKGWYRNNKQCYFVNIKGDSGEKHKYFTEYTHKIMFF